MGLPGAAGNVAGMEDYLNRRHGGMTPAEFNLLKTDDPYRKEILSGYSPYLSDFETEQRINNPQPDPSSDLEKLFNTMTASQERMSKAELDAENKRFEDALKYSREGAKTKMMMQLPGQLTDMARMPGAIALTAAQNQAKNTQDFIRSLALMDNIETIKPGDIPNRKYFG